MANWCNNKLRITGPSNILTRFRKVVEQPCGMISFEKIRPCPAQDIPGFVGRKYYTHIVDWKKDYWGCKWDADVSAFADYRFLGENRLTYYFFTPWTPPIAVVEHIARRYKSLDFDLMFSEQGIGLGGSRVFSGGELIEETNILLTLFQ